MNAMKQHVSQQQGFTLIELLLYAGIAAALLLVVSLFLSTLLGSRIKNQTIAEVEGQGAAALQLITQTIRNASGINTPSPGSNASTLSLVVDDSGGDPTVFDVASGALRVKEGSSGAIALTNSRVIVSNLTVSNFSRSGTLGTIRVEYTITAKNVSGRNEYSFSKTFLASATLRH